MKHSNVQGSCLSSQSRPEYGLEALSFHFVSYHLRCYLYRICYSIHYRGAIWEICEILVGFMRFLTAFLCSMSMGSLLEIQFRIMLSKMYLEREAPVNVHLGVTNVHMVEIHHDFEVRKVYSHSYLSCFTNSSVLGTTRWDDYHVQFNMLEDMVCLWRHLPRRSNLLLQKVVRWMKPL